MESWIFNKLSGLVSNQVYGGQAPPNTAAPYIVFKQVSGVEEALDADTKYNADRWQIDSYAGSDYTAGRALMKQIKQALNAKGLDDGLCILSYSFDSEDLYDQSVEQHYQSSDLLINYQEE